MSDLPPIKVRSVLGCDDIREERTGKFSVVGLFGPSLTLVPDAGEHASGERTFRAHFLLAVDVVGEGEHELQFRLSRGSGGGGIARMTVVFEAKGDNVPFPLGPMTLRVPSTETELHLAIKEGEDWRRIATWSIEVAGQAPD